MSLRAAWGTEEYSVPNAANLNKLDRLSSWLLEASSCDSVHSVWDWYPRVLTTAGARTGPLLVFQRHYLEKQRAGV